MRLTFVAGLILGLSLAFQSMLAAHTRSKLTPAAPAVRVHQVAPWYVANDMVPGTKPLAALSRRALNDTEDRETGRMVSSCFVSS